MTSSLLVLRPVSKDASSLKQGVLLPQALDLSVLSAHRLLVPGEHNLLDTDGPFIGVQPSLIIPDCVLELIAMIGKLIVFLQQVVVLLIQIVVFLLQTLKFLVSLLESLFQGLLLGVQSMLLCDQNMDALHVVGRDRGLVWHNSGGVRDGGDVLWLDD